MKWNVYLKISFIKNFGHVEADTEEAAKKKISQILDEFNGEIDLCNKCLYNAEEIEIIDFIAKPIKKRTKNK